VLGLGLGVTFGLLMAKRAADGGSPTWAVVLLGCLFGSTAFFLWADRGPLLFRPRDWPPALQDLTQDDRRLVRLAVKLGTPLERPDLFAPATFGAETCVAQPYLYPEIIVASFWLAVCSVFVVAAFIEVGVGRALLVAFPAFFPAVLLAVALQRRTYREGARRYLRSLNSTSGHQPS
jgi:hypothetical protein